jgi:hypothetical protein
MFSQAVRRYRRRPVAVTCRFSQNVSRGSVSLRWSARSCKIASEPSSDQNFSVPLSRRLNIFTVDSMWLINTHCSAHMCGLR